MGTRLVYIVHGYMAGLTAHSAGGKLRSDVHLCQPLPLFVLSLLKTIATSAELKGEGGHRGTHLYSYYHIIILLYTQKNL